MTGVDTAGSAFSAAYRAATGGAEPSRPTPAHAFEAARELYLSGERIDMRRLSDTLGVSRTTLYKWCGSREQLLLDVIWSVTRDVVRGIEAETAALRGTARLSRGVRLFLEASQLDTALHALVRNETHAALRLMTALGGHDDRLMAELVRLIEDENERHDMHLRTSPDLLAQAIVRLAESFFYNGAFGSIEPRIDDAMQVVELIMRGATNERPRSKRSRR